MMIAAVLHGRLALSERPMLLASFLVSICLYHVLGLGQGQDDHRSTPPQVQPSAVPTSMVLKQLQVGTRFSS